MSCLKHGNDLSHQRLCELAIADAQSGGKGKANAVLTCHGNVSKMSTEPWRQQNATSPLCLRRTGWIRVSQRFWKRSPCHGIKACTSGLALKSSPGGGRQRLSDDLPLVEPLGRPLTVHTKPGDTGIDMPVPPRIHGRPRYPRSDWRSRRCAAPSEANSRIAANSASRCNLRQRRHTNQHRG